MADGTIKIGVDIDQNQLTSKLSGLNKVVMTSMAAASAALLALAKPVISMGMSFEKAMSGVKAVSGATEAEMEQLTKAAMKAGAETVYSASEAANATEELLKAGLSVEQVLGGGLAGALELASAGEIALADAAEVASTVLNAFRRDQLEVSDAANILAGAANASATDVAGLQVGLSSVSATASSVGMTFEDTATALAVFAQNGLDGSMAGTALRRMLLELQPSTDKQIALFEKLGLMTEDGTNKFFDMEGRLKPLNEISQTLQDSLKGMTDAERTMALETLFGAHAISAGSILMKEGAEGVDAMAAAIKKISAADVAAARLDNLAGDIKLLESASETLAIKIYEDLKPALRSVTQEATDMVGALSKAYDESGMDGLVSAIGGMLADVLTELAEGAPEMADAGSNLISSLLGGLNENSDELTTAAVDLIGAFIRGIGDNGSEIIDTLANIIKDGAPKLPALVPEIIDAGLKIGKSLANGIMDSLPAVTEAVDGIIEEGNGITTAMLGISLALGAFKIGSTVSKHIDGIATAVGGLGQALSANPVGASLAAIVLLVVAVKGIKAAFDNATDATKQFERETENLKGSTEDITTSMSELQEKMEKNADMRNAIKKYRDLETALEDTGLSTDEVATKTQELNEVRQWIIDNSDGMVTAEGAITGALDAQIDALDSMTAAQKRAYDAELLSKYADAQAQLPAAHERNNELLAKQDEMLKSMGDDYTMLAGLQMKLTEAMQLVDNDELMRTEEGMQHLNEILREAGELTGGAYDFQHLAGLSATVDELREKTAGFAEGMQAIDDTLTANGENITAWESVVTAAFDAGIINIGQAAATLGQSVEGFAAKMGIAYDAATGTIVQNVIEAADATSEAVDTIVDANEEAADSYGNLSEAAMDSSEAQAEAAKAVEEAYKSYASNMTNAFGKIKQESGTSVKSMISNLKSNQKVTQEWADGLNKLAESDLDKGFLQQLRDMGPEGNKQVQALVKEMEKGANGKFPELVETIKEGLKLAEEATANQFEADGWGDSAQTAIDAMVTKIASSSELNTAVQQVITAAQSTASNAVAGADFASIGKQMDAGIAQGITSGQSTIIDAAKAVAAAAKGAFESALGIQSPAKEMIPDGEYITKGIAVGISNAVGFVISAITSLGSAASTATTAMSLSVVQDTIAALEAEISSIESSLDAYSAMTTEKQRAQELKDAQAAVKNAKTKKKKAAAQKELNELLAKHENERLADQQKYLEKELKAQQDILKQYYDNVDKLTKIYDDLGAQIIKGLETMYERERDLQIKAAQDQYDTAKKAADDLYKVREQQYKDYVKLLDAEESAAVKALQDQIDAIDAEIAAEEEARRIAENAAKIAELQAEVDRAKNAKFKAEAQAKLDAEIERQMLEQLKIDRDAQKAALKAEIEAEKAAYDEKRDAADAAFDATAEAYEAELEQLKANLDAQENQYQEHYAALLREETLAAEARRLMLKQNQDELIELLETYNPDWYNAGKSFGELYVEGLNVSMSNIESLLDQATNFVKTKMRDLLVGAEEAIADFDERMSSATLSAMSEKLHSMVQASVAAMSSSIVVSSTPAMAAGGTIVYFDQTNQYEFNQPVASPAETARSVSDVSKEMAYDLDI